MKRQKVRTAYIWMLLVFLNLVAWLLLLVIPKDKFAPLILNNWFSFGDINIGLRFVLNNQKWILAFSFVAFNLAFFLTGIARLDIRKDFFYWITQLLLTAFSLLGVLSADLWSVVLIWTALDLLNLLFLNTVEKNSGDKSFFQKVVIKFLGSMLLIWNIAFFSESGFNPLIDGIVASTAKSSLFLAALLHSGIFPFTNEIDHSSEGESGNLLKTVYFISNFVVSFSLVINLPAPNLSIIFSLPVSIISYFIIVISMTQWILVKNFENSLQFLLLGVSGGFVYLYFSGAAQYLSFILALLLLSVLWLILFTHRGKNLVIFPVISAFFVSGLPISLIAFGSRSFLGDRISIGLVVLIVMQILFLLGYLKNALKGNEEFEHLEIWYQAAYLAGLFIPVLSIAVIIMNSISTYEIEIQYWWIGGIVTVLASVGYLFLRKKTVFDKVSQLFPEARFTWLWKLLKFDWLFTVMTFIENKGRYFINGFSGLLEGEGGILWALVLLLLIFTVLK